LLAVAVLPTAAGPSEEEKIEQVVEDVTVAYNLGDLAAMGRHYAPDVAWVPSDYSALLTGWSNVEARFREAHANYSQVQLARENTRIVRNGKVAWASYQWRFAGLSGDQTVQAVGHTTLILEKRGGKWLIVHNHSSLVMVPPEAPPAQPAPAKN
jgi:uncharacterized protein (TIGR02246 family)